MELKMPVDFERLPEFRMLCAELSASKNGNTVKGETERAAVFVWMRLWVELAYLAQTTNKPGLMTGGGAALYAQSLEPMFGEDVAVMELLSRAGVVVALPSGGWHCERFERMNAHLAGNYKSKEVRGAVASALERNRLNIAKEAMAQAMLLPAQVFNVPGLNRPLDDREIQDCMRLIKTLDNCLKISGRRTGEYTEGLIADAYAVTQKHGPEELRSFYVWLATNRESPVLPKRTEQVLARWPEVWALRAVEH